jgi:hypothetical protein
VWSAAGQAVPAEWLEQFLAPPPMGPSPGPGGAPAGYAPSGTTAAAGTPVVDRMPHAIPYFSPATGRAPYLDAAAALPLEKPKPTNVQRYFGFLAFMLTGYAIFGRGFAYIGAPPLFIGEMGLMLGLFLFAVTRGATRVFDLKQFPVLVLIMAWGAFCTIPYIPEYGFDALRDGVMWAYMLYAVVVAGLLLVEPKRLARLFWQYRRFALAFLILMPILIVLKALGRGLMPDVPGTSVGIFSPRRGNTMSHMAVICAFVIAGFAHARTLKLAVFAVPFMILTGAANRAGILTFTVAVGMATVLTRLNRKAVNLWGSMLVLAVLAGVVGANLTIPGQESPINTDRIVEKILSIAGYSKNTRDTNSADWRIMWWTDIVNYTVNGQHFWTGKGFGINLATDDGYQVEEEEALRHPHSIHFNWLARAGVPGAALWVALQAAWAVPIFRRYLECRRQGDPRWSGVFLVLLTYWTAEMINASFDVDLEGPMGGIWFWVVYGIGMAALAIHRRSPEVMYQDGDWDQHAHDQQAPKKRSAYYAQLAAYNWQRPTALAALPPPATTNT